MIEEDMNSVERIAHHMDTIVRRVKDFNQEYRYDLGDELTEEIGQFTEMVTQAKQATVGAVKKMLDATL